MHAATAAATTLAPPRRAAPTASWRDALAVAEAPALPAQTVQLLLVVRGLMPSGAMSGRFDRATAEAVAGFQADAGLEVTGVASRETADALLAIHRL